MILSQHGDRPREEVASALARDIAAREGLVLLHPFDDPLIVAGQAGAGLEALEQLADLGATADVVACPVGGGGLLGGVALALHHAAPRTRIWAVEPEGYNGMGLSLAAGRDAPRRGRRQDDLRRACRRRHRARRRWRPRRPPACGALRWTMRPWRARCASPSSG